jgi:hypothetical protein
MNTSLRIALALAAALLATGCATPPPVLALADKSSANAGIVSARLRQLAAESDRLYAARASNISTLHGTNTTQRAAFAYDVALTRKSGQEADLELVNDLQAWVKDVDVIFSAAAGAEIQRRDTLLAAQNKIDTRAAALQKIAETLAALGKEDSPAERASLLAKFATEVRDDVKKQLDDGSESSARAKVLLDEIKTSFGAR